MVADFSQIGSLLDNANALEDARTLVEEPVEILPKADPVRKDRLSPVKSVENLLSVLLGDPWEMLF